MTHVDLLQVGIRIALRLGWTPCLVSSHQDSDLGYRRAYVCSTAMRGQRASQSSPLHSMTLDLRNGAVDCSVNHRRVALLPSDLAGFSKATA